MNIIILLLAKIKLNNFESRNMNKSENSLFFPDSQNVQGDIALGIDKCIETLDDMQLLIKTGEYAVARYLAMLPREFVKALCKERGYLSLSKAYQDITMYQIFQEQIDSFLATSENEIIDNPSCTISHLRVIAGTAAKMKWNAEKVMETVNFVLDRSFTIVETKAYLSGNKTECAKKKVIVKCDKKTCSMNIATQGICGSPSIIVEGCALASRNEKE